MSPVTTQDLSQDFPALAAARLRPLFAPRGIAVIGASRDPAKLGAAMTRSLAGFAGTVAGINPRETDPQAGRYRSVAEAAATTGAPIDLAVLCVPASRSAGALTEAAEAGVRAVLVCSGGYAEAGGAGVGYQRDLLAAARGSAVALLGPNTSGFLVPAASLTASFVPGAATVAPGPVAVVAASGGVNHALAFLLAEAGIGVSLAVGLGIAADVNAADVLAYLAADDDTRAVALHVESVTDGPGLVAAVRRTAARKPVVALVVGRNDVSEFAQSHTGALATSWRTTRAALRHAGAVLVEDERQLADAVTALSALRLPPAADPGVGVVTAQAGPGLLHADSLRGARVAVPPLSPTTTSALSELLPPLTFQGNPVDTGRPDEGFGQVLRYVTADPAIDLVSAYALSEPGALDLPAAVLALVDDARAQFWQQSRRIPARRQVTPAGPLDEDQAKTLLGSLGVPTPSRRPCRDRAEAHQALADLPGPVAVKILDAGIAHKSDIGGVHLGIRDPAGLDAALDALDRAGARRYLIETMASPGVDLIAGASRDPVFGPVVLVGLGGTIAEALGDVAVAPAPLTPAQAAALMEEIAGRALLDGFRGGPVADRDAIGEVLTALGDLLVASPTLETAEINPLRVTAQGLLALDAVVTLRDRGTPRKADHHV
jgi:acetate---CoA ligase (ADP-forming)